MIVLDASVVVELLINGPLAEAIGVELIDRDEPLLAPHLLDIEVVSALRRLSAANRLDAHRCAEFLAALQTLPVARYPHTPLLARIWELRHHFTSYDAAYIALAEATESILFTCDGKLRHGHRARVLIASPKR